MFSRKPQTIFSLSSLLQLVAHTVQLERLVVSANAVEIVLQTVSATALCPCCGKPSERVHSRYLRTLTDLPVQGRQVRLQIQVRRLFCCNADCLRKVFAERLPELADPHARTTLRLRDAHRDIAFALGGEAGARLANQLRMPTSPDTLLRRIRTAPSPAAVPIRVLGVDDWALRKGQRYGTILCDLERGRPVDLLPERSAEALRTWLHRHPGVQIISRDRADDYIKGATEGAPEALQVADRWHLLRNLSEALGRVVDRQRSAVGEAVRVANQALSPLNKTELPEEPAQTPAARPVRQTSHRQRQEQRRSHRLERYQQVKELRRQGINQKEIARRLGIHRGTVRRFVRAAVFPERAGRSSYRRVRPFTAYLRRRWDEDCRNAARLAKELAAQGFTGSYYQVRRQLACWRRQGADAFFSEQPESMPQRLSARRVTWLLLRPEAELKEVEQRFRWCLEERSPELTGAADLAREFGKMLRERRHEDWENWSEKAQAPDAAKELRTFAQGLMADEAAVRAAMQLPWSNGPVEGQVNRLKTIKRQMYGRANFDLLRKRVLHAA
jgi:transposase